MNDEIKIITEPTVYLMGKQAVCNDKLDRFLADHDVSSWQTDTEVAGEKLVEVAGRLCYMSFAKPRPGGNSAYIDHILEVGHGSVLEHAVYNLVITGVSRSLTHELVRHRAGMGYSQLSQRYVDESDCAFVVPPALMEEVGMATGFYQKYQDEHVFDDYADAFDRCFPTKEISAEQTLGLLAGLKWLATMEDSLHNYTKMTEYLNNKYTHIEDKTERRKAAREAARSVLPNATETKIFVTGNARALRHFIEMRGRLHADAEIRRLAVAVHAILEADSPNIFGDYERKAHKDGSVWLNPLHAKV